MTNNALVSIVIPVYNVEAYLCECVDSVIQQSYSYIEIILVDDASPDNCPMICDQYAKQDSRIKVIHKLNGGLSDARNVGLSAAKGEYVYFLDSDDYIGEDAIESLVSEAVHYSADVVFFDASVFGNITESTIPADYYVRKGLYSNPHSGIEMLRKLLRNNEYRSAVPLLFIKRRTLIDSNIEFCNAILYEDELFTFKLFRHSKTVVHLAESIYRRRIRDDSITTSLIKPHNFQSILIVASEMINDYLKVNVTCDDKKIIKIFVKNILRPAKKIYYELTMIERVALRDKLNDLKILLRANQYLGCRDIKRTCKSMHIINIDKMKRGIIPSRLKVLLRRIKRAWSDESGLQLAVKQLNRTSGKSRVILVGTPMHGNLGDHAIAVAERELFSKLLSEWEVVEIVMPTYRACSRKIRTHIHTNDIIAVSGGGWLGSLWQHNEDTVRSIVCDYPENRIVILPQTIYFEDNDNGCREAEKSRNIYSKHKDLLLCLRDKASYDYAFNNIFNQTSERCLYLPDMVLYLDRFSLRKDRKGILICFRQDREKSMLLRDKRRLKEWLWRKEEEVTFTTTVYLDAIPPDKRQAELDAKLEEYSSAKLIVTDRLHSMLFAAITGTPCIAFDNLTGKVKGVYEWVQHLRYIRLASTVGEAKAYTDELLKMGGCVYDNSTLGESFSQLVDHLNEETNKESTRIEHMTSSDPCYL